jgi:pSer/pThr/pTyr-binding forkhead associated (FHA) protein
MDAPCCGACGHLQRGELEPPAGPPLRVAVVDGAPASLVLRVDGATVPLTKLRTTIGRARDCDVTIADPMLSRRTCAIEVDAAGQVFVEDLMSGCGTVVGGQRVQRAGLHVGDVIRIGDTRLEVEVGEPAR